MLAVGLSAGPAAASSPVCGSTISTNTVLTADLSCPQQGLFVTGANVVLDLNGHTITGAGAATVAAAPFTATAGVRVTSGTGVVVKNGTIKGFNLGVTTAAPGTDGDEIANLTLVANRTGIAIQGGATGAPRTTNQYVHDNTVLQTTSIGVSLVGDNHRFENNTVDGSGNVGVVVNGDSNVLRGNRITNNGQVGINLVGNANTTSDNNQLIQNIVNSNAGSGIALAGDGNLASGNEVTGNRFNGIQLVVQNLVFANNRIESNTVDGNSTDPNFPGIFVGGSTGTVVAGNRVTGTQSTGIHIGTGAVGAIVSGNQAIQNTGDGIGVRTGSSGTRLTANTATSNGDDGIDADIAGVFVQGNVTRQNHDWGVEAVAGTIDGGGNHASANGHAGQCQVVTCAP